MRGAGIFGGSEILVYLDREMYVLLYKTRIIAKAEAGITSKKSEFR